MVDAVLHVVGTWMTRKVSNCRTDLQHILQAAIDLDSHFHEQCSHIYTSIAPAGYEQRHSFPLEEHWMEGKRDYHVAPNQLVGMVVSPALVRRGTANGDDYNQSLVLVKSRVIPQLFMAKSVRPREIQSQGGSGTVMRTLQKNRHG